MAASTAAAGTAPLDVALLTGHAAVALITLVAVCWRAACEGLFSQAARALKALGGRLCSRRRASDDDVASEAERRIRKDKVDGLRRLYRALAIVCVPLALARIRMSLAGQGGEALLQDVPTLLVKAVFLAAWVRPSIVSWRSIDALFAIVCVATALRTAAPFLTPHAVGLSFTELIQSLLMANMVVCTMSIARRDFYAVVPAVALLALSTCSSIWTHRGVIAAPELLMTVQCTVAVAVALSCHFLDEWSRATVRAGLQMKATKQLLSAATGLLRGCCDMVVELDSAGTILGHAHELGSFLLRGSNCSLQGRLLSELMVREGDRRAFQSSLQAPTEEQDMADAMHVRMRDANSTVLKLQLLLFRYVHFDDSARCLVGIRGNFPGLGEQVQELREPSRPRETHDPPLTPVSSISASDGVGAALPTEDVVSEMSDTQPAVLVVDAVDDDFLIRECSAGFRARVGRAPLNARLTNIVKYDAAFVDWMVDSLTALLDRTPLPNDCRITLYMPDGQVTAKCKILTVAPSRTTPAPQVRAEPRDEEDPGEDPGAGLPGGAAFARVRLLFYKMHRRLDSRTQPRWRFPSAPPVPSAPPALMTL